MSVHVTPASPERCHRYPYERVPAPLQEPAPAVRTLPGWAVPRTMVAAPLTGGRGVTTLVGTDRATVAPPSFDAVTATRIVFPTSVAASVYSSADAEAIGAQPAPAWL